MSAIKTTPTVHKMRPTVMTLASKGFIVLPAGEQAEVLGLTPPLTITDAQMMSFLDALDEVTS